MVDQSDKAALQKDIELFYFAYRSFTARPDRILQELALSRVHHRILYFVGRNPALPINELLSILDISKQALNMPLRKLVGLKLIDVSVSPKDRRVKLLTLSATGKKLESRLTNTQMQQLEAVIATIGKTSLSGWREVMEQMPLL